MGLLGEIFKKQADREATSLDIFFMITGLYHGFYEKYGYEQRIDPSAMLELYIDSLKKAKLLQTSLSNREIMGVAEFMSNVAMDSGEFSSLLKEFKKLPVDLDSFEWKCSLGMLLDEMNSKGFNSGLHFG